MRSTLTSPWLVGLALFGAVGPARAHIVMTSPTPRYADLKLGPCGRGATDARTTKVTTVPAGSLLPVTWYESINHPGHYRIAFDPNGQALFRNPASFTDMDGGPGVLLDAIPDKTDAADGGYGLLVRLPNTPCTACTLQLIQVMTDKPPYGDGNDLYYQCADLVLTAVDGGAGLLDAGAGASDSGAASGAPSPDGGSEPGSPENPIGCGCDAGSAGALGLAAALLEVVRRRSTRRSGPRR